jgi:hypothetical protein
MFHVGTTAQYLDLKSCKLDEHRLSKQHSTKTSSLFLDGGKRSQPEGINKKEHYSICSTAHETKKSSLFIDRKASLSKLIKQDTVRSAQRCAKPKQARFLTEGRDTSLRGSTKKNIVRSAQLHTKPKQAHRSLKGREQPEQINNTGHC